MRPDRVYVGWQYALLHGDPGPPPRRPTPQDSRNVDPGWVAAQRREESLLNRPLKWAFGVSLGLTALFAVLWAVGVLSALFAIVVLVAAVLVAAFTGYAVWQGEQALQSRIAEERNRLDKVRGDQERKLFAAQDEHKRQYQAWEGRRAAYDRQRQWYAVTLPRDVDRVDVAGGTLAGWQALTTMVGLSRLNAGGELTVIDLSEGAVAADLISAVRARGAEPQVWILPGDLPRLDLGLGLGREAIADVLSLTVSVSEDQSTTRDLSFDNAILERVLDVLDIGTTPVSIAQLNAALRALAQVGDPRDDLRAGLIDANQLERIGTMFGRGATDRVVLERAWALESQLRKLERLGTEAPDLPRSPLRVLATDRRAGVFGNRVLGTYITTALTHVLRMSPAREPWEHTVFVYGAEKLRGDVLDRLMDACEATRTGLMVAYRSVPQHVKERLGRGNAAVGFMRLGNAEDAKVASEHIGTEHKFVLAQLTETVGSSLTDTSGDSYNSTVGTSDSLSTSTGTSETTGSSRSKGRTDDAWLGMGDSTWNRGRDKSSSYGTNDSESFSESVNESTSWGRNTSTAEGTNESTARTMQRSREFLVEQNELQQLPVTAMIMTHATRSGRRVVLADANPGILALPTSTVTELEEARRVEAMPPITPSRTPADETEPPPNLGPPPDRLDWR
ncbi:MAG TPA: hypothetical protein VGL93_25435 [Streptosporangiaceae bacterium]|jgi:hypothetical protein